MTHIAEYLGVEVIGVLVAISFALVVTLLWKTTDVRQDPSIRTAFLITTTSDSFSTQNVGVQGTERLRPELEAALEEMELEFGLAGPTPDNIGQVSDTGQSVETHTEVADAEEIVDSRNDNAVEGENDETANRSEDDIEIRIRFVDETTLNVRANLKDKLSQIREGPIVDHLGVDAGQARLRIIYNGHVLLGDDMTLDQLGVRDGSVLHCMVQRAEMRSDRVDPARADGGSDLHQPWDLSGLFFPLFGLALAMMWVSQVVYSNYFALSSTAILVTITLSYLLSVANAASDWVGS